MQKPNMRSKVEGQPTMSAKFGLFESDGQSWRPNYGEIDWSLLERRLIADEVVEAVIPIGFDSGDGLIQECTQENLVFRSSDVAPLMDMIAQADPRDSKDYIWFREDNPERFDALLKSMGHAALRMHSRYPLPDTVMIYLDRRQAGNDPQFLEQSGGDN